MSVFYSSPVGHLESYTASLAIGLGFESDENTLPLVLGADVTQRDAGIDCTCHSPIFRFFAHGDRDAGKRLPRLKLCGLCLCDETPIAAFIFTASRQSRNVCRPRLRAVSMLLETTRLPLSFSCTTPRKASTSSLVTTYLSQTGENLLIPTTT